jgi:hypothetical protein
VNCAIAAFAAAVDRVSNGDGDVDGSLVVVVVVLFAGVDGLFAIAANKATKAETVAANVVRPAATGVARAGIVAGVAATKKTTAPKNKSKTNKR